jgi:hypothetical protein
MLEMRISDVVDQVVQHALQNNQEGQAVYLNFDVRLSCYDSGNKFQYSATRDLHLLYHKLLQGANISVFSAITPSPFNRLNKVAHWTHEATHDTEWRRASIFNQMYFAMAEEVNNRRGLAGLSSIAPIAMKQHCDFPLGNELFKWVPVSIRKDPEDQYGYRRLITVES